MYIAIDGDSKTTRMRIHMSEMKARIHCQFIAAYQDVSNDFLVTLNSKAITKVIIAIAAQHAESVPHVSAVRDPRYRAS